MKFSLLSSLVVLAGQGSCTPYPELQWDPDTVKDCVGWYNNVEGESCESVRSLFGISPELFHKWNPSIGLDCKPWDYQSYCIITQERIDNIETTTVSSSTTTSATTSGVTLGPSPTSWAYLGCYIEDSKLPILEKNVSPAGGDAALTIPNCKSSCFAKAYDFAGVQEGNQCWCSSYVGGEWTGNQTDCNAPCTGDKETFCGGKGLVSVFEAEENRVPTSDTSITTDTGTRTASVVTATETVVSKTHDSGAVRNMVIF